MTLKIVFTICKHSKYESNTHTSFLTVFSCQGYGFGLEEKHDIEINEHNRSASALQIVVRVTNFSYCTLKCCRRKKRIKNTIFGSVQ